VVQSGAVSEAWQNLTLDTARIAEAAGKVAAVLVAAFVLYRIVRFATGHLRRFALVESNPAARAVREQRLHTLGAILNNLARFVIIGVAAVMVLSAVGLDVTPIIAGAGVAGIAVAFGAQSLVKDFFSGFFIFFENQYGLGDQVTVSGQTGTVEGMTLRVTTLRDADGNVHYIPNGKIDTVTVIGRDWARVRVDVTIPYREDLARALETVDAEARRWAEEDPSSALDKPEFLGVDALGQHGAVVSVAVRTKPGAKPLAGRELRRRIKLALDRENIRLAYMPGEGEPPAARA
jgi:small conductance mechanosensitive channel